MVQPFLERDISWLSFNYRVLQEAKDFNSPLFERIKFLAIYSSNLDEFFSVRVAQYKNLLRLNKKETKKYLDIRPKNLLKEIHKTVNKQQIEFTEIYENQIIPELRANNIFIQKRKDLNPEQIEFIESYFFENLIPYVQPVLLVKNKIKPFLNNGSLYLTLILETKGKKKKEKYGLIKIPSEETERFIKLPSPKGENHLILLDDIIRHEARLLYPGYKIVQSYSIKLTRDAELYIGDEFEGDLLEKIKSSIKRRKIGPPSRLVYDREMPLRLLQFLFDTLELENTDLLPEGRYHNNSDFFGFPNFGLNELKSSPPEPIPEYELNDADIFDKIGQKDHFIHPPYTSYDSVINFFEAASKDPKVTEIKIVQYRVSKKSKIMKALINAVKNGKKVSVFIEVKARFDEELNLQWGKALEEAGVNVTYSIPGIKVHSKIAIVKRKEGKSIKNYCFLGTGNFNEDTAKVYSDVGIFTADKKLTEEVEMVFNHLQSSKKAPRKFKHLLVGQYNLREELESLIDFEIKEAKAGRKAQIILKMNSLQDPKMIKKLYEASNAGVKVNLIIRGIFCLKAQIKGFSENINAVSIVDQYLEHSRIFIFHHKGENKTYLSSADWMTRNLSHRIEVAFPVYNPAIKKMISSLIKFQLKDNTKARVLDKHMQNKIQKTSSDGKHRAQNDTYFYLRRKLGAI